MSDDNNHPAGITQGRLREILDEVRALRAEVDGLRDEMRRIRKELVESGFDCSTSTYAGVATLINAYEDMLAAAVRGDTEGT